MKRGSNYDASGSSDEENVEEIIFDDNEDEDENEKTVAGTTFPDDSSSDEEWEDATKNRVGTIPMEFYDEYDHIGYNILGEKVLKSRVKQDELDKFLASQEDPKYWRTVRDVVNDRDVVLSKEEYDLVKSLVKKKLPAGVDPYEPFLDLDYEDSIHPVSNRPPKKSAFVPSKWEAKKVRKLVQALRKGWIKIEPEKDEEEEPPRRQYHMIWNDQDEETPYTKHRLPPAKLQLPGTAESYNPPGEYLFSEEEKQKWGSLDPEDRSISFIPQKFDSLRAVPLFKPIVKERFERCRTLYLNSRMESKPKLDIEPSSLIPQLPSLSSLKPFPTRVSLVLEGHTDAVRSLSVDPSGQWLVSGSLDKTVRLWEVETGRCLKIWHFEGVYAVSWNPNPLKPVVAVAVENKVYLINTQTGSEEVTKATIALLSHKEEEDEQGEERSSEAAATWKKCTPELYKQGIMLEVHAEDTIKQLSWHYNGDYLISVSPEASSKNSLLIHQVSRQKSQNPFKQQKGKVQCAQFHPSKPYLFVATQTHIKMYNLAKLQLEKKLLTGVKWISSFDMHPQGDNLIMSSYDKKVCWFDLDLSSKPYKVLKYHKLAVRKVVFHKRYPLFASCSDDVTVHVFHGMVYDDLGSTANIVPLKVLRGHQQNEGLGILDCLFHPTQPWLFSSGADNTIRLYT